MRKDKQILLAAQMDASEDEPAADRIFTIGTVATVVQLLKLPDGTVRVLVEGGERARISHFTENADYFEAEVEELPETNADSAEARAVARAVADQWDNYVKLSRKTPPDVHQAVGQITEPSRLADAVAAHLTVKIPDKQSLLEQTDVPSRLERILALIEGEIGMLQVERKIRNRVKRQMEKTQREYYLNEQMKAIQRELGEGEDGRDDIAELEARIRQKKLPKEAKAKAEAELKKLRQMSPMSAESTVVRNYLDWILSLPWGQKKAVKKDINKAEAVLAEDHYGLEKVKDRILEYLAVQARTSKVRGPILCLVGPPGVGKTSLGKSIAKATGRDFVRVSLGGVRDEAVFDRALDYALNGPLNSTEFMRIPQALAGQPGRRGRIVEWVIAHHDTIKQRSSAIAYGNLIGIAEGDDPAAFERLRTFLLDPARRFPAADANITKAAERMAQRSRLFEQEAENVARFLATWPGRPATDR